MGGGSRNGNVEPSAEFLDKAEEQGGRKLARATSPTRGAYRGGEPRPEILGISRGRTLKEGELDLALTKGEIASRLRGKKKEKEKPLQERSLSSWNPGKGARLLRRA